jgi:hypothetical protein
LLAIGVDNRAIGDDNFKVADTVADETLLTAEE